VAVGDCGWIWLVLGLACFGVVALLDRVIGCA
jgi:hypothetical protein